MSVRMVRWASQLPSPSDNGGSALLPREHVRASAPSRIRYNNPDEQGALILPYHYEMVSDQGRVQAFKTAICRVVRNRIVLESGAGVGIMSILAARAGAAAVYTTEIDPRVAAHAIRNFEAAGVLGRARLLPKSTLDLTLADLDGTKADCVIAENLSTWQVVEPQIPIMNHVNRVLATSEAVRLPTRIFNRLELAQSRYEYEGVTVRTHYFEFTGIKGPRLLSRPRLIRTVDLGRVQPLAVEADVVVPVEHAGVLNSLRLTSPLEILPGVAFSSSDSLMPPVVVPLQEDLAVRRGDRVLVQVRYRFNSSWEQFHCAATLDTRRRTARGRTRATRAGRCPLDRGGRGG